MVTTKAWMNEWWMNGWMHEWMNDWGMNDWGMNAWMNDEWMSYIIKKINTKIAQPPIDGLHMYEKKKPHYVNKCMKNDEKED